MRLAALVLCLLLGSLRLEARPVFSDREDGISCSFFDVQLGVPWADSGASWADKNGKAGGSVPFDVHEIDRGDLRRVRRIDVTALVSGWWNATWPNDGLLLRMSSGDAVDFFSREVSDTTLRPQLLLHWPGGRRRFIEPAADASLDCSTFRGVGRLPKLTSAVGRAIAVRFDVTKLKLDGEVLPARAELVLIRTGVHPVQASLDVLRLLPPFGPAGSPSVEGLARRYPGDRRIGSDPDVIFADGFEGRRPESRWSVNSDAPGKIVDDDLALGFAPLAGSALRVTIPRGGLLGLDMRLRLRDASGVEPEEVYFRYYLRLGRDWLRAIDGGKLPGFAGTYNKAGWGGRPWDGKAGWSLRGAFGTTPPAGHASAGRLMLGTYAYHAKSSTYGEGLVWSDSDVAGLVETERWYCIEQHLKMNTPGREDGVLEVWVDGLQVLKRTDLRLRDIPNIRVEEVWMNFYHGGTRPAPAAMHAWIDGVVIARRRIGPMHP